MTTTTREIERKYAMPAGAALPDLNAIDQVSAVSEPETFTHEAIYFDTAELRLARAGITLRRRTGGTDDGWHLKLPADGARDEIATPLTSAVDVPPADLADLVQGYTRSRALIPVGRIVTRRTRTLLIGPGGATLAEVVSDEVSAEALAPAGPPHAWSELEVELADGDASLLDDVEAALAAAGIEPAASPSKLAQLMGDRLPGRPSAPSKRSSAGEVMVAYLREQLEALLAADPRVRRDEEDAVHKMRVAARRARSTLQAFGALLNPPPDELIAELRWLGAELGTVRDLDVLPGTLAALLEPLPPQLIVGPVRARMTAQTAHDRTAARGALLATLGGERYFALLTAYESMVEEPPLAPDARDGLHRSVRRTFRRLERRIAAALAAPQGSRRDEAIHDARKAAKRARYAGEATTPAFGAKAAAYAKAMKDLQEHLGEHQDSVVAREILREMGIRAHLAGENAFTYGLLYGRSAARADAIESDLPSRWHHHHHTQRHWLT